VHILHLTFFFFTMTTFASQIGYWISRMKHVSSNLWTSTLAIATFLSNILGSFLLTSMRSKVFHTKTSMFLSKNNSNSVSSSSERSWEIITTLSGTLGYRGTLFVSYSGSMIGLFMVLASFLTVFVSCWPSASSSCSQLTFLWPRAKPCSI
jgi:hypothetical protein